MLRYRHKPPRRPAQKPTAKAAPRPLGEHFNLGGAYGLLIGLFGVLAAARIIIALAAGASQIATVGDRLAVNPASVSPVAQALAVPARQVADPWAPPGAACRLSLAAMQHPGGTLTVMAVRQDGVMLSWAGGATAPGQADCHAGATPLLVADADYSLLLAAQPAKH
jgi:hypothetical protein